MYVAIPIVMISSLASSNSLKRLVPLWETQQSALFLLWVLHGVFFWQVLLVGLTLIFSAIFLAIFLTISTAEVILFYPPLL